MILKADRKIVGIGTDIEQISRFRDKPFDENDRFYKKLFTENEIEYCLRMKDPYPSFTARFCAKEAIWKALSGVVSIAWHDLELLNNENGKPFVRIISENSEKMTVLRRYDIFVSLSHNRENAIAYVIIQE